MKILITGSEGKIAKELIKILDGELLLIDKKSGDNLNDDATLVKITSFKPEIIFHLAASFERTDETPMFNRINFDDNIRASYRLNSCIANFDYCPKQYIFASSYLVYDPYLYLTRWVKEPSLLSESSDINPRNLIGSSKLYTEKEIDFLKRNIHKDMTVSHARIFRVYGEGGQEFVSRCIEWKRMGIPVDIWNPENSFDYVHTSDCASALKAMIGHDGIYNVGYGVPASIKSIIGAIGCQMRFINKDDLFEASCADTSKLEEETGWRPKVNVLDWIKGQKGQLCT